MNKIAAYQIALENLETEKRAGYLIEAYGTCDGYLPEPYLQAFDGLEKEAAIKMLQEFGKGMLRSGAKQSKQFGGIVKAQRGADGAAVKGSGGWQMNKGLGAGDQIRYGLGRLKMGIGRRLQTGTGQAALIGGAGVGAAGTGYLGYKALK